ncbi:MAG: PTS sugar transporter subunit IIC, partial [Treponema sp.]|nr:PTS sugar transporter subunit IIC [Treponema sp.]
MITGSTVLLAFFLALFTGVCIVVIGLGFNMWAPLFYGLIAGILVGNLDLGLKVGAICALMGLGFYTYGGATMPDFSIGAIFGVFMASQRLSPGASSAEINAVIDVALPVVVAIALLMSLFDILGRGSTTVFQHGGDNALARRNIASFQRWHLAGTIPWALSRSIPVFIGMLFI